MKPLVHTVKQAVELLGGEEVVTEYWVKKTARRLRIGTRMARTLVFTEAQLQELVAQHALQATQPAAPKSQPSASPRAAKPKPTPLPAADASTTPLRSRPERARSYGRTT